MEKGEIGLQSESERLEDLDILFHKLALEERIEIPEEMESSLSVVLEGSGANLEVGEEGRSSLREKKYTEKHPDRRDGLVEIWGEKSLRKYEEWAEEVSEKGCPRFTFKKEKEMVKIEGSRGRGLRQFLADLSSVTVGEMDKEKFIKRTQWRVKKGRKYFLKEKAKEIFGKESRGYRVAVDEYKRVKNDSKKEVGVVAMVPWFEGGEYSYVDVVWEYLIGGELPGEEI